MNTVLITGCSSVYGLETARHFHAQGWSVIATMRTPREGILPPVGTNGCAAARRDPTREHRRRDQGSGSHRRSMFLALIVGPDRIVSEFLRPLMRTLTWEPPTSMTRIER
jgi:NAD(P)-dependent dehydrogenase (short-subunit alcohol dehydrogenase family)